MDFFSSFDEVFRIFIQYVYFILLVVVFLFTAVHVFAYMFESNFVIFVRYKIMIFSKEKKTCVKGMLILVTYPHITHVLVCLIAYSILIMFFLIECVLYVLPKINYYIA